MKVTSILTSAILVLFLTLQGCAAPTATSDRYRMLSEPMMASVQAGMTQADTRRILGEPWNTTVYPLKPTETYHNWKWRNHLNEGMVFGVVLDKNGVVIRTESWRDVHDAKNISASSWN